MSDIEKSFQLKTESIQNFFSGSSIGYYIPIYQRKYSWNEDNIKQLMIDICYGVDTLLDNPNALHFMGTIILNEGKDEDKDIKSLDQKAVPDKILKIIDGQQRISTIAILACKLYE